jgi:hypothetical protein
MEVFSKFHHAKKSFGLKTLSSEARKKLAFHQKNS